MAAKVSERLQVLTGHQAVAEAMRQIEPDVVAAYPITPQSEIMHYFAEFVANGKVRTELITVESEHSAMSACIGAAVAGARTMTATASQGLALMIEIVYIAAAMRCPIVMAIANRALSGPINIHCDHSDAMLGRDAGVAQLFAEDAQEAYDFMVMAPRIAEHEDVLLPVWVNLDGFTLTHTADVVELLEDELVKEFVGEYKPRYPLLDVDHPTTQGPFALPEYYFELKRQQVDAMGSVPRVLLEVQAEFSRLSGREYQGFFEPYYLDDAEYAMVVMGSTAGTAKEAIDRLRERGERVGLLKLWLFRPFPREEVAAALEGKEAVAILDRAFSLGSYGPLFLEVSSALYEATRKPRLYNYTYGLGGRDTTASQLEEVFRQIQEEGLSREMHYINLRE
ncbi:MAG: pyruvate ferredoxin oxidoreductase [Candidatus Bipolaricaulia bacterium]